MRLLNVLVVVFLLVAGFFTVNKVEAQEIEITEELQAKVATPPSSYELFFPITPGKVLGDPLYPLKQFKETLRELITFGKMNKAEYNLTLSEKRLIEGEYLYNMEDYENASQTMDNAQTRRDNVVSLYQELSKEDNETADILKVKINESFDKQLIVLDSLKASVPSQQQENIQNAIDNVNDLRKHLSP